PSSCLRLPPPPLSPRSPYTTLFRSLLVTRMLLGGVTAAAGPLVASLVGDYFAPAERGRIYGYILAGELAGAGFGFAVTGDVATRSEEHTSQLQSRVDLVCRLLLEKK